jgi:hypothetical protein
MNKFENEILKDTVKRQQLSLDYASENSFLSLLRTAGILTGIAGILIRLKKAIVFVRLFLIIVLISIIFTSINYYQYIIQENTFQSGIGYTIGIHSIIFAFLLCLILVIMILVTFKYN